MWSCVWLTSEFKLKFGQIKILTTIELYLTEDTHKSIQTKDKLTPKRMMLKHSMQDLCTWTIDFFPEPAPLN